MKNFYSFFLLFIVAITTARAQRNVDLQLLPTRAATNWVYMYVAFAPYDTVLYNDSTKYYVKWDVVNLGPDPVQLGDTLCVTSVQNVVFKHTNITLAPGDTITLNLPQGLMFSPPASATFPYVDTLTWCDSLFAITPASATSITDPPANNHNCVPMVAYGVKTSGIDELTDGKGTMLLYPNPASGQLNVKVDMGGKQADVVMLLRNTIGQTVYSQTLGGPSIHSIDISNLPPGVYTAELRYDNRSVISKVVVQ